jgi:hypothetical protein
MPAGSFGRIEFGQIVEDERYVDALPIMTDQQNFDQRAAADPARFEDYFLGDHRIGR